MATMKAARLHRIGADLSIDEMAVPAPRPTDVLVRVKACGVILNMKNVIAHYRRPSPRRRPRPTSSCSASRTAGGGRSARAFPPAKPASPAGSRGTKG